MTAPACAGCAHAQRRFRLSKPALHCLRFHMPAIGKCLDFRHKPGLLDPLRTLIRAPK